jgi:hypothetical protein
MPRGQRQQPAGMTPNSSDKSATAARTALFCTWPLHYRLSKITLMRTERFWVANWPEGEHEVALDPDDSNKS